MEGIDVLDRPLTEDGKELDESPTIWKHFNCGVCMLSFCFSALYVLSDSVRVERHGASCREKK